MRTRDWVNKRQTQGSLTGDGLRGRWSGPSGVECDVYFLLGGMKWALTYPGLALVETGAVKRANIETKPRRKTAVNNVVIDFLARLTFFRDASAPSRYFCSHAPAPVISHTVATPAIFGHPFLFPLQPLPSPRVVSARTIPLASPPRRNKSTGWFAASGLKTSKHF